MPVQSKIELFQYNNRDILKVRIIFRFIKKIILTFRFDISSYLFKSKIEGKMYFKIIRNLLLIPFDFKI